MRVDDVTMAEALELVRAWLGADASRLIVTPNAEIVMRARADPAFRALLNRSDLSIPDGAGLLLAGRILGTPLREQVTGTDLAIRLAGCCAEDGRRVYLLGAAPGVAAEAGERLRERYPGLIVAGAYPGSPQAAEDEALRARIAEAAPVDLLLVAYGAPAQERWLDRNQSALGIPVGIGVGGVFDFVSGRVPRAPAWLRRIGLDWAFRLVMQPWRWRRQLALPAFIWLAIGTALRRRLTPRPH